MKNLKNFTNNQLSTKEVQSTIGGRRAIDDDACRMAGGNVWVINGDKHCVIQG
ncbi:hypothetical protein [uncultured Microscilla sp.]|uniref:hypothetical protein n=1 Tax=uncultured Microscilla sp. TaxID=432653 RepID=UPI00261DDBB9|nr:hypothetical protein [uncultured Microscilla sp.]